MIVVKIGGSLYQNDVLPRWLTMLADLSTDIVIVAGGGPFADQVRAANQRWPLSEAAAHNMALLAMQQFSYLMHDLEPRLSITDDPRLGTCARLWVPSQLLVRGGLASEALERSWQTTSDTIAAWLATDIDANRLCLIKSKKIEENNVTHWYKTDLVDENFSKQAAKLNAPIDLYHASDVDAFAHDCRCKWHPND